MSKTTLTLPEKTEILTKYLSGQAVDSLTNEYDITPGFLKDIVDNKELRTDVEKRHIELTAARESRKIDEVKEQILSFISSAISEAMESPDKKIIFLDKVSRMISDLDRISRLNREQNTSNDTLTTKNIKIDVSQVIKELKTPEDKKNFLRKQLVVEGDITE